MPRKVIVIFAILGLFLILFLVIALRRQPPEIPADQTHLSLRGRPDQCLTCHGPQGERPRGPNHPVGAVACWSCHFEVGEAR
jgi:nitrate reductase cytochrome c-type subunit